MENIETFFIQKNSKSETEISLIEDGSIVHRAKGKEGGLEWILVVRRFPGLCTRFLEETGLKETSSMRRRKEYFPSHLTAIL